MLSLDSDFFILDAPRYIPLSSLDTKGRDVYFSVFERQALLDFFELPSSLLPLLAAFLGTDYVSARRLMGIQKRILQTNGPAAATTSPGNACTDDSSKEMTSMGTAEVDVEDGGKKKSGPVAAPSSRPTTEGPPPSLLSTRPPSHISRQSLVSDVRYPHPSSLPPPILHPSRTPRGSTKTATVDATTSSTMQSQAISFSRKNIGKDGHKKGSRKEGRKALAVGAGAPPPPPLTRGRDGGSEGAVVVDVSRTAKAVTSPARSSLLELPSSSASTTFEGDGTPNPDPLFSRKTTNLDDLVSAICNLLRKTSAKLLLGVLQEDGSSYRI